MTKKHEGEVTIRDLYPEFSEEELRIAEENLTNYANLVFRIHSRLSNDPVAYTAFQARLREKEDSGYSLGDPAL